MVSPSLRKITARGGARTTMTETKIRTDVSAVKQLLASDKEFLKPLIQAAVQEALDDGDAGCGERGAYRGTAWLSLRLLSTRADHLGRQDRSYGVNRYGVPTPI